MISVLEPFLAELDYRLVIVIAAVLLITAIVALVKKAIKVGLVVMVIALMVGYIAPTAFEFQRDYKIGVEDAAIHMVIKGQTFKIESNSCKEIILEDIGNLTYGLTAKYNDGNITVKIPRFMTDAVIAFGNKYGVPVTIK